MPQLYFTDEAKKDLTSIRAYTLEQYGEESAVAFINGIEEHCTLLAQFPRIGRVRPELDPDVHSFPFGTFVIFYYPKANAVTIARIYHASCDPDAVV